MASTRKILGLAIAGHAVTAMEAVSSNGGAKAVRVAELLLPEEIGFDEPVRLGKALRQMLRAEQFTARRCVIGIEAGRVTAREKSLPPGAGAAVGPILALAIEREFASDRDDLVFDYVPCEQKSNRQSVLLAAAPKSYVEHLGSMAQAAGLRVARITASAATMSGLARGVANGQDLALHVSRGGTDLTMRAGGALRMLRRLSVGGPAGTNGEAPAPGWLDELAGELRRVLQLLPTSTGRDLSSTELVVWDDCGQCANVPLHLTETLGVCVRLAQGIEGMDLNALPPGLQKGQVLAAGGLALTGLRPRMPQLDFLHSRLAPAKKTVIGRKVVWAAVAAAVVLALVGVVAWDWHQLSSEADDLQARLAAMARPVAEAEDVIRKDALSRTWLDRRPKYLDCLRELTLAFPREGGIWATNVTVGDDMRVVFSGKAANESAVLGVLDRLKANRGLTDVKPLHLNVAGGDRREVAFSMSFQFLRSDRQ